MNDMTTAARRIVIPVLFLLVAELGFIAFDNCGSVWWIYAGWIGGYCGRILSEK